MASVRSYRGTREPWLPWEQLPVDCRRPRSKRVTAATSPKIDFGPTAEAAEAEEAATAAAAAARAAQRKLNSSSVGGGGSRGSSETKNGHGDKKRKPRWPPIPRTTAPEVPRPACVLVPRPTLVLNVFVPMEPAQLSLHIPDEIWLPYQAVFRLFGGPPRALPMETSIILDGLPLQRLLVCTVRRTEARCGLPPTCISGLSPLLYGLGGCWLLGFQRPSEYEFQIHLSRRYPPNGVMPSSCPEAVTQSLADAGVAQQQQQQQRVQAQPKGAASGGDERALNGAEARSGAACEQQPASGASAATGGECGGSDVAQGRPELQQEQAGHEQAAVVEAEGGAEAVHAGCMARRRRSELEAASLTTEAPAATQLPPLKRFKGDVAAGDQQQVAQDHVGEEQQQQEVELQHAVKQQAAAKQQAVTMQQAGKQQPVKQQSSKIAQQQNGIPAKGKKEGSNDADGSGSDANSQKSSSDAAHLPVQVISKAGCTAAAAAAAVQGVCSSDKGGLNSGVPLAPVWMMPCMPGLPMGMGRVGMQAGFMSRMGVNMMGGMVMNPMMAMQMQQWQMQVAMQRQGQAAVFQQHLQQQRQQQQQQGK